MLSTMRGEKLGFRTRKIREEEEEYRDTHHGVEGSAVEEAATADEVRCYGA